MRQIPLSTAGNCGVRSVAGFFSPLENKNKKVDKITRKYETIASNIWGGQFSLGNANIISEYFSFYCCSRG